MISRRILFCAVIAIAVTVILVTIAAVYHQNKKCDLYKGSWVFDKSYPLYLPQNCPFIIQEFNCTGNGRPDLQYQKYRWQPNHCNLPRWDGRDFARRVRGKSIMFVGDSLSRNQWLSLACMIYVTYPDASYIPSTKTSLLSTIAFPQLNLTLLYLQNAFIVDITTEKGLRVLKLDSVANSSKQWLQNDILIFDTWHWWLHTGRKQPWDLIQDGNVTMKDMGRADAYEKALKTWGRWVDQYVDVQKVAIFLQGVSPNHWNAREWGMPETQRCGGEKEPLKQLVEQGDNVEQGDTKKADIILKEVLTSVKKPVHLLDINELSQFRVDAHPSIYGNLKHIDMDCTHWCLPGVPDTWNQLLYATLRRL